ncbi:hypothetical protein FMUND_8744 [Fusarium mundagurra]|uniref:Uncharacterized protein n=1 Tax=Fusarium mundagurra TaxID=1567541 RepID=A0A8H5YFX8_9HYPO|nr:hypothetical protein FMUND_8744 [Fusarium mundagurra]
MPTVPVISFCAVGQIGFWKSALEEVKETCPPLRNDAPRRPRTYLPPLLPVKERMDEIYRFQSAVDQSIVFLRNNATSAEEVMVLRVIEWLATAQRNETSRIQRKIWVLDPQRFRREFNEGYFHFVDGEPVLGPDPGADAGANASGAAGDAAGSD